MFQGLLSGVVFTCYYSNEGSIDDRFPIAISRDLKSLKKEPLLPYQLKNNWRFEDSVEFCKIEDRFIGKLSGREVYEIKYFYDPDTTSYTEFLYKYEAIQAIYIENEKGRFSPVFIGRYTQGGCVGRIEPTEIDIVKGKEILTASYSWHGTGHHFSNIHLMYDREDVHLMQVYEVIEADFRRVLPKNLGVMKGGYFSIKELFVGSYLWKDSDCNASPTGGIILMWYSLAGYSIKLDKYKIDPKME
jgi:hypothetical protein